MSETYYFAIPKLGVKFVLGGRWSYGDEVFELKDNIKTMVTNYIEGIPDEFYEAYENIGDGKSLSPRLAMYFVNYIEPIVYFEWEKFYTVALIMLCERYALEYDIYSEYDREKADKYKMFKKLDLILETYSL
jgi:hypothetical protein